MRGNRIPGRAADRRLRRGLLAAALALVLSPARSRAAQVQGYPVKPVRLIVPFAAGGTTDVLARLVAERLPAVLGEQVVVDNRPGANGNIGSEIAARAPADGYTLVLGFDGTMAINPSTYGHLPFDPLKDFVPIVTLARVPLLIVVPAAFSPGDLAALIAWAHSHPGALNYSSAGPGSTGHLAGELLSSRAGIRMTHIAYKGGSQAVQDLLAGELQMVVTALPTVEQHVRAGRLRAIAWTSGARVPALAQVPTVAEAGFAGFDVSSWYGLLAPSGTPPDIVKRLNRDIVRLLADPALIERLARLGTEPVGDSPERFAATLRADTRRWAALVAKAQIHLE
jgi:tripartite-type tricarboxylate transporter receptor subunit TctC